LILPDADRYPPVPGQTIHLQQIVDIAGHHDFFVTYILLLQKLLDGLTFASGRDRKQLYRHTLPSPQKLFLAAEAGYFFIPDVILDLQSVGRKNTLV
jgi:hypothetical protein